MSMLGQIRIFSKVLSKVSKIRNRGAKQKVLNALEKNEFFQRFIHDPQERKDFLTQASPYVRYKFYPKGTSIVELQQAVSSLSIIVKGKALYYTFKESEDLRKEGSSNQKGQVISLYIKYVQEEHLEERFKKWLSKHELGTKALRKRMASISTNDEEGSERESVSPDDDDFRSIIEHVLRDKNPILPPHLREADLSFEEKLVLLSKFGMPGEHIKSTYVAMKARKELVPGETFGEETLIKPQLANFMIIATEDTHIVSFLRHDIRLLFSSDIKNLHAKMDYLHKIFPEAPRMNIMEMAYYLEERVLSNSELVYKEGEEADALYLIKNGEIELSMIKEPQLNLNEEYFSSDHLPVKSKKFNEKHRLMLGKLLAGSIFGEDEIIKKMNKRVYSAKACQPSTFVYVIRKNIFHQIFETYFPEIIETLKDWMELKYKWREQRIKKEQKVAEMISEDNEASLERDIADKKVIKKYNKKTQRLVFENGSGIEQLLQGEQTDIPVHAAFRVTNNASPNTANTFNMFGLKSDYYFSKELKKTNQERSPNPANEMPNQNQAKKIALKLNFIRDRNPNKDPIEKQKTKLFVENQTKLNKFKKPLSYSRLSSKSLVSPRKQFENTLLLKTEAAPQILNFDKIKEIQQHCDTVQSAEKPPQENSSRKMSSSILPQVSPRFFLVRSYRPSQTSLNSLEVDQINRRNSSILHTEQENIAPFTVKNLDIRRGTTMPSSIKDEKLEERKHDDFGLKNFSRVNTKPKKSGDFMIRSLASLQQLDKNNSSNTKSQISSKPGSLAYLDGKTDEIVLNNSVSTKNTYASSLKEINVGRKMLSPRGVELLRTSPRLGLGLTNFKFRVHGTSIDRSEIKE